MRADLAKDGAVGELGVEPDLPPTDDMAEGLDEADPHADEDEWTPLPIEGGSDDADHQ